MGSEKRANWDLVFRFAQTQRSLVTAAQLRQCGLSGKSVHDRSTDGWLRIVRPGVYAVGGQSRSGWEQAVAIGLLCGPGSALSHGTAAAIHRLPGLLAPRSPEISVPAARHPCLPGAIVHRVARLDDCDVDQLHGVGVTSPERTVVDLAARTPPDALSRLIDEGTIARRWTVAGLLACVERVGVKGRGGVRTLRELLADRVDEPLADSMLEQRMIRILAPYAPFETQFEVVLDGKLLRLDIAWPWWRVAAEVDGWDVRSRSRTKFLQDRLRMNLLEAHGWRVVHLTSEMDTQTVLREVGRFLPHAPG